MEMKEWAENEVKLAIQKETSEEAEDSKYMILCLESALKAYKTLLADEHSGLSFSITSNILKRLLNERPLTVITDSPEEWTKCSWKRDNADIYQCNRKSSLFKHVYPDGTITYSDNDRVTCKISYDSSVSFGLGKVTSVIDTILPIKMPYSGDDVYTVIVDDYCGAIGIIEAKDQHGTITPIMKFYNEVNNKYVEISKEEFYTRKQTMQERIEQTYELR